jgi:putative DNA primase/helicase
MFENIPQELKELNQWVVWQAIPLENGKTDKVPYNPRNTNGEAKTDDPNTWASYKKAVRAYTDNTDKFAGIGFVFFKDDPYIGIDLDGAFDPETGEIKPWAVETLDEINSYTEFSQSGKGFHIIVKSDNSLPEHGKDRGRKKGGYEIYDRKRYFALTGNLYVNRAELKTVDVMPFYNRIWNNATNKAETPDFENEICPDSYTLEEIDEILFEAFAAKNGQKFRDLWYDTWQNKYGYDEDHSRASQTLCNELRYWFGRNIDVLYEIYQMSVFYENYRDADRRSYNHDLPTAVKDGKVCLTSGG